MPAICGFPGNHSRIVSAHDCIMISVFWIPAVFMGKKYPNTPYPNTKILEYRMPECHFPSFVLFHGLLLLWVFRYPYGLATFFPGMSLPGVGKNVILQLFCTGQANGMRSARNGLPFFFSDVWIIGKEAYKTEVRIIVERAGEGCIVSSVGISA